MKNKKLNEKLASIKETQVVSDEMMAEIKGGQQEEAMGCDICKKGCYTGKIVLPEPK